MHNIRTSGRSERLQKMRAVVIPSWKGDAMPASRFGRIRLDVRYYIRNIAPLDNEMLARLLTTAPNRT